MRQQALPPLAHSTAASFHTICRLIKSFYAEIIEPIGAPNPLERQHEIESKCFEYSAGRFGSN